MTSYFCIPSARPSAEANLVLQKWRDMGYGIALWIDKENDVPICDFYVTGKYPGYAQAVNAVAAELFRRDPEAEFAICGGDDTTPDPDHSPDTIAQQCVEHFGGTFGVMQPTGDRWANGSIDRIAGSAWMGREWCERANGGLGPLWPEFAHMFVDECLLSVAEKLGVYWRRPDLTHMHNHFMRQGEEALRGTQPPPHLVKWNTTAHWNEAQAIYNRLKQAGFAPCMPIS